MHVSVAQLQLKELIWNAAHGSCHHAHAYWLACTPAASCSAMCRGGGSGSLTTCNQPALCSDEQLAEQVGNTRSGPCRSS